MKKILFLQILVFIFSISFAQQNKHAVYEQKLIVVNSKIFPFYYGNQDSLELYSTEFTDMLINYIKKDTSTLDYSFQPLIDSGACDIANSADGLFRVYSWDTWMGGTMHIFKNIFQYRSGKKTWVRVSNFEEGDLAGFYSDIFILKANNKTYYLAISNSIYSTKDVSQSIKVFTIENRTLNDSVKLIKTSSGFTNQIDVAFDLTSVSNRSESNPRLIKYDANKKIISIPIVYEDGKVTDKFISYQFNGKFFERMLTQKKKSNQKKSS